LRRGAVHQIDRVTCSIPLNFDRLGEQCLTARPTPVNAGFRDTGPLGNLLDTRSGDTVLDEEFQGGLQDRLIDHRVSRPPRCATGVGSFRRNAHLGNKIRYYIVS
jgi:hypothetical protein